MRPLLAADFTDKMISDLDNEFLISHFTEVEIKETIWFCEGSKSPGPDGFNFCFFKESWNTLKDDILRVMAEFHQIGKLVKGFNPSFIVVIPKKEAALGLGDYRPISLISGLYKIISKVLAGRLSKVLDSIILDNQSAFIRGTSNSG